MSRLATRIACALVVSCIAAFFGGCTKKIAIHQYPAFWTPELKTIAVVPFRNTSQDKSAGDTVAEQLARAMAANGTYQVFNRYDLKTVMDEQDLAMALSGDTKAAAKAFDKTGKVQAILVGAVTNYTTTSRNEQRQEPQYTYDRNGNPVFMGNRIYTWTRNEANVSVTASLIRVSDGASICSTSGPVSVLQPAEGSPPSLDQFGCLTLATQTAVAELVRTFAVTQQTVELDPDKDFRVASDYFEGKYTYAKAFKPSDTKMIVVLRLPAECDRNRFRIAISKVGMREYASDLNFVWDRNANTPQGGHEFIFSPKEISDKSGPGDYEVKFFSGPEPVLIQKVAIKQ